MITPTSSCQCASPCRGGSGSNRAATPCVAGKEDLGMLTEVGLYAFRNYLRETLELNPGSTLLLGANAQGKTNLLEAIYFAATGRSPRAATLAEMVMWEQAGARVTLSFADGSGPHR